MPGPSYTSLSALVAAIAADAGVNSTSSPQTDFTFIGSIEGARREGPPRIVWIPGDEVIADADQDEDEESKTACQRRLTCEVRFLATDFDACSLLISHWIAAVFRTQTPRTCRPIKGSHAQQAVSGSSRWEATYQVEVDIPVIFETYVSSEVLIASHTGTVTDPA